MRQQSAHRPPERVCGLNRTCCHKVCPIAVELCGLLGSIAMPYMRQFNGVAGGSAHP